MTTEIIILSVFGSLIGKLLIIRGINDLPKQKRPEIFNLAFFISACIDIILGVGFTYVQYRFADTMNVLLAIQISATAPLIASSLMKTIPSNSVFAGN
ncbi:MAG: hypothetical protein R6W68_11305 [Ignavibacteriaceae bacterium]